MKSAWTLFLVASSLVGLVVGQNASSTSSSSGNGTSSSTSSHKTMAPSSAGSSSSNGGGGLLSKILNATVSNNSTNYTSEFLVCNANTAQFTCSNPNQKAGILADTCDIMLLDLLTHQEVIGVTKLNKTYNNFTLSGCLVSIGQVCFAGCYANCTCTQPDGSPCGSCSQFISNASFPNSSSPTGGGNGGSGSGTGAGGSNTGGAGNPSTSAGSVVHAAVWSMTPLAVAGFVGAILSWQVM